MRNRKKWAGFLTAVVLTGLIAGCTGGKTGGEAAKPADSQPAQNQPAASQPDDALTRVKKAGKLVFATDDTYPPMEFHDEKTQELIGFDIDLANEIAKRLGVKAEFQPTKWDGLLTGLATGKYDAVISSMNVTEERQKEADFVPYANLDQVFVIKAGAKPITKLDELKGLRVAVQVETTSEEMAKGVQGAKVTSFDSFNDTFVELKNNKADVVVVDEPVGRYYAVKDPGTYAVSGSAAARMPVGIAFKKADKALSDAVKKAIDDIKKDGTFKQLSTKWFGDDLTNK